MRRTAGANVGHSMHTPPIQHRLGLGVRSTIVELIVDHAGSIDPSLVPQYGGGCMCLIFGG